MNTPFKKTLLIISLSCLSIIAFHSTAAKTVVAPIVDVYKTDQISADDINKKFGKKLLKIKNIMLSPGGPIAPKNQEKFSVILKNMSDDIKKMGDFAFVSVAPVRYPNVDNIYITIDIIDQKDRKRLELFTPEPTKSLPDPDHLIALWQEYEKTGFDIFLKEKSPPPFKSCPAFHCIFGFEHAALKKYQAIFENNVPKDKAQLIAILRQDKDPEKRAVAAFLLAHLKNGEEIINILTPSMYDSASGVRNNVIRTLAMTVSKVKNPDFPIDKAVTALKFPAESDRNKSLYLILNLVTQPRYAKYIQQHASQELMDNLKMSQLNLHDTAYEVLVAMSREKFDSRDYTAWEHWLKSNKS
jgi:hypothetical protein